ncbi:MBL fold metallo-hydrolase [Phenylobacterium sp.]|uniref:MBL fold metallo-hydrolase n=1 Tax=Phenylobacterium sp. TaxID=1871053 RepID=UPI0025D4E356|nr:MBL fold metallo-hydrolase [Phenylobacterium sp.]MBX3483796.1 MBL fold metallo-hydrolase [Phenylobacterium sp.]
MERQAGRFRHAAGAGRALALVLTLATAAGPACAGPFKPWIDGTDAAEPATQTQRYDRDTYVIRQSLRTNFEGPFLYLLFGRDRALLLDTGAGNVKIRPAVEAVIAGWLKAHGRASIPLVVAHSHGHGDHHQGDAEFADRPDTTVVGLKPEDVAAFFGIADWPKQIATFDLGGRKLSVIPTPGHHPAHIMIYDPKTRLLLSGDTLYPGRIYVPSNRFGELQDSLDRVAAFGATHKVAWALGAHIEMSRKPGEEFPDRPPHPDEHPLELPFSALLELQAAIHGMAGKPARAVRDDFVVTPILPR